MIKMCYSLKQDNYRGIRGYNQLHASVFWELWMNIVTFSFPTKLFGKWMGYEFVIHLQQPTMEQVHTTNTATGNKSTKMQRALQKK